MPAREALKYFKLTLTGDSGWNSENKNADQHMGNKDGDQEF